MVNGRRRSRRPPRAPGRLKVLRGRPRRRRRRRRSRAGRPVVRRRRRLLEDLHDLARGQRRVRRPDERRCARDEGRGERRSAFVTECAAEHTLAGRGDRDPRAAVREGGMRARLRRRRNCKPGRPEEGGRIHRCRPIAVADRRHKQDTALDCVRNRGALRLRCVEPADAEIDDLRAVVHGVADRRGFRRVGERAARAARLDDDEARICRSLRRRGRRRRCRGRSGRARPSARCARHT